MTEPRLSWPLRIAWAFVAIGTAGFAFGLVGSVGRQRDSNVKAKRIDVLSHQARWSADHAAPDEALAALTELATLDPNRPRLAYDLGVVQRSLNHHPEALRAFEHAVERAPGDAAAWSALAQEQRLINAPEAAKSEQRARLLDPTLDAGAEVLRTPER